MRYLGAIFITISMMMFSHFAGAQTSPILVTSQATTMDVYLYRLPEPYSAFEWNRTSERLVSSTTGPRSDLSFSIPNEYIVKTPAGRIDLARSLARWQSSAGGSGSALPGAPIVSRGVTYYPHVSGNRTFYYPIQELVQSAESTALFYNYNQSSQPEVIKARSLSDIANFNQDWERRQQAARGGRSGSERSGNANPATVRNNGRTVFFDESTPDVLPGYGPSRKLSAEELSVRNAELEKNKISANYTETLAPEPEYKIPNMSVTESLSVVRDLDKIANSSALRCNRTNDAAQCMVCNCLSEARGESDAGQIGVGRVTLTRVTRQRFANSVCGVVWQYRAFSWTLTHKNRTFRDPASIRRCATNMKKSIRLGIWEWDHFYAYQQVTPSWSQSMINQRGVMDIGNHRFLNSGYAYTTEYVRTEAQRGNASTLVE